MVSPIDPLHGVCPRLHDYYIRSVLAAFCCSKNRRPVCPYKASNSREYTRLNLLPHATSSIGYGSRHKHIFAWCCDMLQISDMELYQVLRPSRILSRHMLVLRAVRRRLTFADMLGHASGKKYGTLLPWPTIPEKTIFLRRCCRHWEMHGSSLGLETWWSLLCQDTWGAYDCTALTGVVLSSNLQGFSTNTCLGFLSIYICIFGVNKHPENANYLVQNKTICFAGRPREILRLSKKRALHADEAIHGTVLFYTTICKLSQNLWLAVARCARQRRGDREAAAATTSPITPL